VLSNNENQVADYFSSERKEAMFSHYSNESTLIISLRARILNLSDLRHSGKRVIRKGGEEQECKQKIKDKY
jgi:hypothetical protein